MLLFLISMMSGKIKQTKILQAPTAGFELTTLKSLRQKAQRATDTPEQPMI